VANRHQLECLHCKELFRPHPRNTYHQKFCSQPQCRQASKAQSQRRWLSKPQNQDYFRGSANVERIRQWRQANPGYWKRSRKTSGTLQEVLNPQPIESQGLASKTSRPPLQDLFPTQDPLLVGLISQMIDSPLQDHIEQTTRRLILKGRDILDAKSGGKTKGNTHANQKTCALCGTVAARSRTVQLGGSTLGPPSLHPTM
jgi:hypothetical protein